MSKILVIAEHLDGKLNNATARAIFGQFNDHTAFNANALYSGSTVSYANSPDGSLAWQKMIDDNPDSGVKLNGSTTDDDGVPQALNLRELTIARSPLSF